MRTAMTHEKIGDLKVNTILTYCNPQHGEFQHMVDVWLPIVEGEADVKQYLDREYFPQLQKSMKLGRIRQRDLIKISTAADWTRYEKLTGLSTDSALDYNNGKWFFCNTFGGYTEWSRELMKKYQFGRNSTSTPLYD